MRGRLSLMKMRSADSAGDTNRLVGPVTGGIEEIRRYIQRNSHVYAEMFVDRVFESAERLIDHPLSGRVVPEFEAPLGGSYLAGRLPRPLQDARWTSERTRW